MNWYYAKDGQQAGPVDDLEFARLVAGGALTGSTLVWREGLAEWQPYEKVWMEGMPDWRQSPGTPPSEATAGQLPKLDIGNPAMAGTSVCAVCNQPRPSEDLVRIEGRLVCATCKPKLVQQVREGVVSPVSVVYAGFWIRFVAKFVDGLLLGIVLAPIMVVVVMFTGFGASIMRPRPGNEMAMVVFQLIIQLGFIFLNLAYSVFFVGKYGATPGKMACKLKVITADGQRVSYARAAGRCLAEILSGMLCYIGYIIAGFDSEKRALHDHMCSTRVIYK